MKKVTRILQKTSSYFAVLRAFQGWGDSTELTITHLIASLAEKKSQEGNVTADFLNLGFAVGYLFGKMFDIRDKPALDALNRLKKKAIKEKVLPLSFFPHKKVAILS